MQRLDSGILKETLFEIAQRNMSDCPLCGEHAALYHDSLGWRVFCGCGGSAFEGCREDFGQTMLAWNEHVRVLAEKMEEAEEQ